MFAPRDIDLYILPFSSDLLFIIYMLIFRFQYPGFFDSFHGPLVCKFKPLWTELGGSYFFGQFFTKKIVYMFIQQIKYWSYSFLLPPILSNQGVIKWDCLLHEAVTLGKVWFDFDCSFFSLCDLSYGLQNVPLMCHLFLLTAQEFWRDSNSITNLISHFRVRNFKDPASFSWITRRSCTTKGCSSAVLTYPTSI